MELPVLGLRLGRGTQTLGIGDHSIPAAAEGVGRPLGGSDIRHLWVTVLKDERAEGCPRQWRGQQRP